MSYADFFEKIIIPIIAAVIGALCTFWYQKRISKKADQKLILATLMAYRHMGPYEPDFVKALNMIDIVFHDSKSVRDLLHRYLTVTGTNIYSTADRLNAFYALILKMCEHVGYNDLKHSDVNDFFVPAIEGGKAGNPLPANTES